MVHTEFHDTKSYNNLQKSNNDNNFNENVTCLLTSASNLYWPQVFLWTGEHDDP